MSRDYRDEATLREYYHERGLTLSEIGDELETSTATVSRWMDKHGIEKRSAGPGPSDDRVTDPDWMEEQYSVRQKSVADISDETGCSNKTILDWLKKHDIATRPARRMVGDARVYDCDFLQSHYYGEGMTAKQIAEKIGVGKTTVLRHMEECGIDRRDKSVTSPNNAKTIGHVGVHTDVDGYVYWSAKVDKKVKNVAVHQMLAVSEGADPHKVFSQGDYHVHHKNGIPWDNRPENVELLSAADHNRAHANE